MHSDRDWWRRAVVYQVYPRSFADTDGDGIGDLRGILSRIDHLRRLSVDAVWLSPFYPSPLGDGGYDVADYRDVDPRLGTLADLDALVAALHDAGIRLIVDIVPNHTSEQHAWFRAARADGAGSPARERYHFRPGAGPDGDQPPTDWVSTFGGPAWTRTADGEWYLHTFSREQPDLNWDHPDVRDDFLATLAFWADRGVDGFRVDVAQLLAKDLSDPLPSRAELERMPRDDGRHPLEDRDEVQEVYRTWRALFERYDPPRMAVAEAWVAPHRVPRYAAPDSLGQAFNFDLLEAAYDAAAFREIVTRNLALAAASGSSSTWVLSNHDIPRHPTRYGIRSAPDDERSPRMRAQGWMLDGADPAGIDRDAGLRRARAASLFVMALPGSLYLYQGEELGLHEVVEIAPEQRQDPSFFRSGGGDIGRDGSRVPLPWTSAGVSFGFGDAAPHLPQPAWFSDVSVAAQDVDADSTLSLYRRALALRRTLQTNDELAWVLTRRDDVLHIRRPGGWEVVANFGAEPYAYEPTTLPAPVLVSTDALTGNTVPADTTVWFAG